MSCIDGSHNMFDATEKKPNNNGITKIDFYCSAMTQHINARYKRFYPLFVFVLFGFGLSDRNSACAIG